MPYKNKSKQLEYQKLWMRKRRQEFFADKQCKNCKTSKNLQLHHLNPDEKKSHKIWSWSKEKRNNELRKCIILCKNCHKEQHKSQAKCGSSTKYRYGCRSVSYTHLTLPTILLV